MADAHPKDPVLSEAGKRGAKIRWGEQPRIVRLDELSPNERRLVVELVELVKSSPTPPS